MESTVQLLMEALAHLSPRELDTFRDLLLRWQYLNVERLHLEKLKLKEVVFLVVLTHGGRSVEEAGRIFKVHEQDGSV